MTPPRLGQEGAGGVIQADELLLVETVRVDALLQLLDVLLGDLVERTLGGVVGVGGVGVLANSMES